MLLLPLGMLLLMMEETPLLQLLVRTLLLVLVVEVAFSGYQAMMLFLAMIVPPVGVQMMPPGSLAMLFPEALMGELELSVPLALATAAFPLDLWASLRLV